MLRADKDPLFPLWTDDISVLFEKKDNLAFSSGQSSEL